MYDTMGYFEGLVKREAPSLVILKTRDVESKPSCNEDLCLSTEKVSSKMAI